MGDKEVSAAGGQMGKGRRTDRHLGAADLVPALHQRSRQLPGRRSLRHGARGVPLPGVCGSAQLPFGFSPHLLQLLRAGVNRQACLAKVHCLLQLPQLCGRPGSSVIAL